jgi:hypothetical protein
MMDFAPAGRVPRKEGARRIQPAHPRSRVPPRRQRLPSSSHANAVALRSGEPPPGQRPLRASRALLLRLTRRRCEAHPMQSPTLDRAGSVGCPHQRRVSEGTFSQEETNTERRNPTFCARQSVFERIREGHASCCRSKHATLRKAAVLSSVVARSNHAASESLQCLHSQHYNQTNSKAVSSELENSSLLLARTTLPYC